MVLPMNTDSIRDPARTRRPAPKADLTEIARTLALWMLEGEVYELRALNTLLPGGHRRGILAGFYNDPQRLAAAAAALSDQAEGV